MAGLAKSTGVFRHRHFVRKRKALVLGLTASGAANVSASQTETGDTTAANLSVINGLSASLAETGDTTVAAISVVTAGAINITANQEECSSSGGCGLTAEQEQILNDIKAKTDQLTFTNTNEVDANCVTGGGSNEY